MNFLTPTAVEMFYLLTRRPDPDTSLATRLQAPFTPFSGELWGSLGGSMLLMGALYLLFEDKHIPKSGEPTKTTSVVQRMLQSTYTSTCEMFNCGVEVENPHASGGTSSAFTPSLAFLLCSFWHNDVAPAHVCYPTVTPLQKNHLKTSGDAIATSAGYLHTRTSCLLGAAVFCAC